MILAEEAEEKTRNGRMVDGEDQEQKRATCMWPWNNLLVELGDEEDEVHVASSPTMQVRCDWAKHGRFELSLTSMSRNAITGDEAGDAQDTVSYNRRAEQARDGREG